MCVQPTLPDFDAILWRKIKPIAGLYVKRLMPFIHIADHAVHSQCHRAMRGGQKPATKIIIGCLKPPPLGTTKKKPLWPGKAIQHWRIVAFKRDEIGVVSRSNSGKITNVLSECLAPVYI